jgi:hypothetical protein
LPTEAEKLILRGLHNLMSLSFAPNDKEAAAKHYARIPQAFGSWFVDYVEIMKEDPLSEVNTLSSSRLEPD